MTLTSETTRVQYSGDGSTTAFAITFVFWDADDIQAVLTDANSTETTWVRGTQYTISGGSGATGTLTVNTSPTDYTPASGETLTIKSNLTKTQNTDLPEGGALPSSALEQQLDKIVRLDQQASEELGRALKFSVSSTETDVTFPDRVADSILATAADKTLQWSKLADLSTAFDTLLSSLAAEDFLKYDGTNWINRTPTEVRTDLGLGSAALLAAGTADAALPTNADLDGNTRARAAMSLALYQLT